MENGNKIITLEVLSHFKDLMDKSVDDKIAKIEAPTITIGDNGNWYVNGVDTGTSAQGIVSSVKNSTNIIIDEENKTISSVVNGETIVVANYTESIEEINIENLF